MKTIYQYILLAITILVLASCSEFRRVQRSADWRSKYDAAIEYYNEGKYNKASILLEELLPIIRGTKEAELGSYYFAYSYFYQKQYILSANHFQEFLRIFGRSEYAIDAAYMHAYSLFLQSPEYNLDQTSTYEAMNALQTYLDKYPTSEKALQVDRLISTLQVKLETKAYNNAKLFYKIGRYRAALVIFDNFHQDFPDSKFNEEVKFMGVEMSYKYAKVSILSKQEERFKNTITHYEELVDTYPTSQYLKEAERFFIKSREELTKLAHRS